MTWSDRFVGSELLGRSYVPPFDCYFSSLVDIDAKSGEVGQVAGSQSNPWAASIGDLVSTSGADWLIVGSFEFDYVSINWRILPADFVTTESGTGIVHIAPAFGEDDFRCTRLREQSRFIDAARPELLNAVAPDGKFTDEAPDYCRGRWVKDCDKDIIRDLKQRGLLFHQEQYLHDYPFCWRAEEDPLIQYPRESWFIRTTAFKDAMLENNSQINWLPEHIKDGRFGNFLESNVDWALSRERYWGTPLPIWVCSECGHMEAVSSYDELLAKDGVLGTESGTVPRPPIRSCRTTCKSTSPTSTKSATPVRNARPAAPPIPLP